MAQPAALASMAANEQDKFWEYHDGLFAEPNITPSTIDKVAAQIGLDMDLFKEAMKSSRLHEIVAGDVSEAGRLGVTGTPTIFINGRKLKQRSLEGFQAVIDDELGKVN